ncbi:MAG: glycosyltransferase family 1 protein [Candidatus Gottesmanbacteria bacterium]|nr:glycosyltransferase family 1 protein [Candidatus Gottesmanbacteria bacterium]
MRIGIDARLINETGVGRYIRNLVRELGRQDKTNEYTVFLKKKEFGSFELPNPRWKKVLAEVGWHTLSEQVMMPWIMLRARLDLVHIPYFNIPIFYPGRMVATIHDLTILHFDTGKATTLPWVLYKLRRAGYRIALAVGLRRVKQIIAVSKTTKEEIIDHFHVQPEKIVVTYEGVDERVKSQSFDKAQDDPERSRMGQKSKVKSQKRIIDTPYFLYVGNAYPHKNLETLLSAFQTYATHQASSAQLVLVGKEDFFYRKIKKLVSSMNLDERILFFGHADDWQLANLYAHAMAFVFPSLMEGFGLPALEALALGCPVIVSDIPVFREILTNHAVYFNPHSSQELYEALRRASESNVPSSDRDGVKMFEMYSWSNLASDTLGVYRHASS